MRAGAARRDGQEQAFWTAISVLYIGGVLLHYAGAKPEGTVAREVIPVDEPTALDWVTIGGILYFI